MSKNHDELDVRIYIPIERHERLLKKFKELPVNESFIFINDHDPIPLYYEFKSIHGDVVGWEYLNKGGIDWKVKVTRTGTSIDRKASNIATMLDLREIEKGEWVHVVFHRFGMMEVGTTMEIISKEEPSEIYHLFQTKATGRYTWTYQKQGPDVFIAHVVKKDKDTVNTDQYKVTHQYDVRPYAPTQRHDTFYQAFAQIKSGEAFDFINDHDPKPLYYQMKAESKDPFKWEYLEEGPDAWIVRVIKL